MIKVGVITNPESHRNKSGLDSLNRAIDGRSDVHHAVVGDVAEIPEILSDFAGKDVGLVAVVGGDGTVQATLTELFNQHPFEALPTLAVLPGGRTNLIAAVAGIRSDAGRGMAHLLDLIGNAGLDDHVNERRIVRIDNVRGAGSQFGMFFGTAGICRAIQSCRRSFQRYGMSANMAAALTIAGSVARLLSGIGGDDGICRGDDIEIALDGDDFTTHSCLLLLATTLDRLMLGTRPFWSDAPGTLHFSYVCYPPRRLGLHVSRLLYGGPHRRLPADSYFSRDAETVRLKLDGPFVLDGEFFEAGPGREIVLSGDERLNFVRL